MKHHRGHRGAGHRPLRRGEAADAAAVQAKFSHAFQEPNPLPTGDESAATAPDDTREELRGKLNDAMRTNSRLRAEMADLRERNAALSLDVDNWRDQFVRAAEHRDEARRTRRGRR